MRVVAILFAAVFLLLGNLPIKAQPVDAGAFLTIGAIRQGLNEALVGVQSATVTAGSEARALGNSLQANVQNVIADIDQRFGKRLNETFDKLDAAERQFATDARDLIYRTRAASTALAGVLGDESRRTIGEADITAYNTSYSLPCRTQVPRIVYWTPTKAIARGEEIVVSIHGNFLNYGQGLSATIDGKPSALITRSDRVITVRLPKELIQRVSDLSSVAIALSGLQKRVIEPRFMSWLFGCSERYEPAQSSSLSVALQPRFHYRIQSEVWATFTEWSLPFVHQTGRLQKNDDNCDHDENLTFSACVPAGQMRVTEGRYSVRSKSGPSSFGPATASGDNCILFSARLKGSGYRWVLGVKDCRGSARLDADWELIAQRRENKETGRLSSDQTLAIGQYSHAVNNAQSPRGEDWKWRYIVRIEQLRGSQSIAAETLTDARMDNGNGWVSAMKDGVLTVSLPAE